MLNTDEEHVVLQTLHEMLMICPQLNVVRKQGLLIVQKQDVFDGHVVLVSVNKDNSLRVEGASLSLPLCVNRRYALAKDGVLSEVVRYVSEVVLED